MFFVRLLYLLFDMCNKIGYYVCVPLWMMCTFGYMFAENCSHHFNKNIYHFKIGFNPNFEIPLNKQRLHLTDVAQISLDTLIYIFFSIHWASVHVHTHTQMHTKISYFSHTHFIHTHNCDSEWTSPRKITKKIEQQQQQ